MITASFNNVPTLFDAGKDTNFNTPQKIVADAIMATSETAERKTKADKLERSRMYGMFRVRTANECLKEAAAMPDPVELYPVLIVEGEIVFLFADTGIGKTVFAVQMAIDIAQKYKVLYLDLELSDKQFQKRYKSPEGELYHFPNNFIRVDFTPLFTASTDEDYTGKFLKSLKEIIKKTGARIVFVDNMTKLVAGDTDSAKTAIPILNELHHINRLEGITFVIMEHNKKVDNTRPICLNDLQGSKMKSNFADSIFSIGRSFSDKYLRYIKQLKVRNGDHVYDTENVMLFEMTTIGGYLHFEPRDYVTEYSLLKQPDEGSIAAKIAAVENLKKEGKSNRTIGAELGISEGTVRNYLKKAAQTVQHA